MEHPSFPPSEKSIRAESNANAAAHLSHHHSMFESFRFRDFRWFWFGTFSSLLAVNMQMITRGWLILRLADDSPLALSLVMIAFALPMSFFSPIGGVLADRFNKKRLVMICLCGNAVVTLLVAVLDWTGLIKFWHLLITGAINGSLLAFNLPSRQSLISDIVPDTRLMNAISLNASGMNLSRILGPAIGGFLIIYLETYGVFFLISFIHLSAMSSLAVVQHTMKPSGKLPKSLTGDFREGLSYSLRDPVIFGLIILMFMTSLFGFCHVTLLPAWARETFDIQADRLGVLMMVMGIGSLIGSLILAALSAFTKRGILLLLVGIGWGVGLIVFAYAESYVLACLFLLLVGLVSAFFMSLNMTLLQTYSVPDMRGRIMSLGLMTFGTMALSAAPFGAVAEKIGTPNAIGLSGMLMAGLTLLFTVFYRSFRKVA